MLDYGLNELALPEVVGIVIREHTASIAVLEKLELQFVENTEYMGFPIVKYVKSRLLNRCCKIKMTAYQTADGGAMLLPPA